MVDIPVMYVVFVEGDTSEPDYIGVTKSTTPIGAEYRIVGPLANAMKKAEIERLRREVQEARAKALEEAAELVASHTVAIGRDGVQLEKTEEAPSDLLCKAYSAAIRALKD